MRVPSVQTVVVKPEQIRLVRRGDSKKWQAHYKLEHVKTWFRRSTDTANVKEAAKIAERLWMKATFDFEEGRPVISRRFKPVAEVVLHPYGQKTHPSQFPDQRYRVNGHRRQHRAKLLDQNLVSRQQNRRSTQRGQSQRPVYTTQAPCP